MRILDKILNKTKSQTGGLVGKVIKKGDGYFENPNGVANSPTIDEKNYTDIDKAKVNSGVYNYKGVDYLLDYKPTNMTSYGVSETYTKKETPATTSTNTIPATTAASSNPKFMSKAHFLTDMALSPNKPLVLDIDKATEEVGKAVRAGVTAKNNSSLTRGTVQQPVSSSNTQPISTSVTTTIPEKKKGLFSRMFGKRDNKLTTSDNATNTTSTTNNTDTSPEPVLPAKANTSSSATSQTPVLGVPTNNPTSANTTSVFDPNKINTYTLDDMGDIVDENGNVISFNSEEERKAASELFGSSNKNVKEIPTTRNVTLTTPTSVVTQPTVTNSPVVTQSQTVPSTNNKDIPLITSKKYEGNIPTIGQHTDNVDGKYTIKTGLKRAGDDGAVADNELYISTEPTPYGLSPGKLIKPDNNGDIAFSKEYEGVVLKKDGSIYKDGKFIKKLTAEDNEYTRDYIATDNHQIDKSTEEKNLLARLNLRDVLGDEVLNQYPELQQVNVDDLARVNTNKSNRNPVSNIYDGTKTYKLNNEGIIVDESENPVEFKTDADYNKAYNSIWNNTNNTSKQTINSRPTPVSELTLPDNISTPPQAKPNVPVIDTDKPIKPILIYPAQQPANVQPGVSTQSSQNINTPAKNKDVAKSRNISGKLAIPDVTQEETATLRDQHRILNNDPENSPRIMSSQTPNEIYNDYSVPGHYRVQNVISKIGESPLINDMKVWDETQKMLVFFRDLPIAVQKRYIESAKTNITNNNNSTANYEPLNRNNPNPKESVYNKDYYTMENFNAMNADNYKGQTANAAALIGKEDRDAFYNKSTKDRGNVLQKEADIVAMYEYAVPAPGYERDKGLGFYSLDSQTDPVSHYKIDPKKVPKGYNIDIEKVYTNAEIAAALAYHRSLREAYVHLYRDLPQRPTIFKNEAKRRKEETEGTIKRQEREKVQNRKLIAKIRHIAEVAPEENRLSEEQEKEFNENYDKKLKEDEKRKKEYRKKQGLKNQSGGYINKTKYRFI